jgi:hypothetical protein
MAISKKYSRRITVDGVVYRWRIPPEPDYDQGGLQGRLLVTIWSEAQQNCALYVLGEARPDNLHHAIGGIVTPRRVALAIRAALAAGWNPEERGSAPRITLPPLDSRLRRDVILMLEDDPERLERFRASALQLGAELVVWRSAHCMIAEIAEVLATAALISLDHDLEPEDSSDPGDGLDVAKHMAKLVPTCPVIVHTSNGIRGDAMVSQLEEGGWQYHRVMPLGDDWIEVDWLRAARAAMRKATRRK